MLCTDICYKIITKVIKVIKQCFTNTFNSIEFCMVYIKLGANFIVNQESDKICFFWSDLPILEANAKY